MYLFINTAITNHRNTPCQTLDYDRVEIFKYCLSSLSVMPFEEAFIYLHFYPDENLKDRKQEIFDYIKELFPNIKLHLYDYRNEYQSQWIEAIIPLMNLSKKTVWFLCNDDHIFIDSELDTIYKTIELIENNEDMAMFTSHWPELLYYAKINNAKLINNSLYQFTMYNADSILMLDKNLLYKWFFGFQYGNKYLPRTDWANGGVNYKEVPVNMLVPLREQVRHMDAYGHVHISHEDCPTVDTPIGFFEDNINLSLPTSNIKDPIDIPLFWKNKIKSIEISKKEDRIDRIIKTATSFARQKNIELDTERIKQAYS